MRPRRGHLIKILQHTGFHLNKGLFLPRHRIREIPVLRYLAKGVDDGCFHDLFFTKMHPIHPPNDNIR